AASIQRTATFDEGNDHPGWHFVYFFTPPGRPGPADITVRTPDGVEVLPGAFEYFESSKFVPLSGSFFRILYDRRREHLYLSHTPHDRVLVYDLSSDSWLNPIPTGKSPVGISLSPGGSRLLVANSGDKTVSILDPDGVAPNETVPVVDPLDTYLDPKPVEVAA